MCFVDLEKAFDRVPCSILWEVLWEYGVRGPLLRAVQSLYNRSRSLVRIANCKSDLFPVHVGLQQGSPLSPVLFIVFMDRISRRSQGLEGVRFGDHRISSLIFADDVVLLAPSSLDLQHALGRFSAECEAAGIRVSTSKSEAMVLDRNKVACTLQVGGEVLPQVEEFKYLGVLFTSEGRMDREIDRRIGAAAAVMRSMYRSAVVKKELSWKAKLSIYQLICVPTLTYGHELWVMPERVRSRIQAAEMSFLCRVVGHSLRDRVRSSVNWEELGVEPLLLHIKRGQLRWLRHLFRMPPGRLPGEVFRACPTGKRPQTATRHNLTARLGNLTMPLFSSCQNITKGSSRKPAQREVARWMDQSVAALQDVFDDADWDMFRCSSDDINVFTEAVVGIIWKLADDTVQKTIIRTFPNQKPWVDKTIRDALRSRATAYNVGLASGDMDLYAASYNFRKAVKEAKQRYGRKLESQLQQSDSRSLWQGLRTIDDNKAPTSGISNADSSLADELNFEAAAINANANANTNAIANAKANASGYRQEENGNTKNAFIISEHDVS
ncbi:hypothetical protein QTP70_013723 [Hemibagrus guttatus]|uniref:Reverse transcriptase domain-containing protein n=1 Tax=Hemibagrus guttatus TaxID=175788 RepID=A0AAE0PVL3_9TELE|nr:hypothetical protein QTP70_013723 [Hemibagrus guttatus]